MIQCIVFTCLPSNIWIKSHAIVRKEHPNRNFKKWYRNFENPCWKSICPWREKQSVSLLVKDWKLHNGHTDLWHPIVHSCSHREEKSTNVNCTIVYWIVMHLSSKENCGSNQRQYCKLKEEKPTYKHCLQKRIRLKLSIPTWVSLKM